MVATYSVLAGSRIDGVRWTAYYLRIAYIVLLISYLSQTTSSPYKLGRQKEIRAAVAR